MKFHIRHAVDVSPAQAIAAYGSPAFYQGRLPRDDIEVLGVVRHEDTGERVLMEVRFKFTGNLGAPVRAFVDPARMSWVTRTELWPAALRSEWVVLPDHYPDRLTASGAYRFEPGEAGPDSTVVVVEGELKVHVPIVGRTAERVIVSDLGAYLEDEVASITARTA